MTLKESFMNMVGAIIRWLCNRLIHRTGYKAIDSTGKIVTGCYECRHNVTVHNKFCDAHQCEVSLGPDCRPLLIVDPFDVPVYCSMIAKEA